MAIKPVKNKPAKIKAPKGAVRPRGSGGGGCRRRMPKQKFWLVCTINLGSEVLFTVPLSIMKKFSWDAWSNMELFKDMVKVFEASGREPGSIDMFRYDPERGTFAVRALPENTTATGYFLEEMPWINEFEEPLGLGGFLVKSLGVSASRLNRRKMEEEAEKAGSREVKIPSER